MVMMLLALALSIAHAAEPTGTLTLACTDTLSWEGVNPPIQINPAIVIDFQKKTIVGLDGSNPLEITRVDETSVVFRRRVPWQVNGMINRVTGELGAISFSEPKELYHLQCKPTQRMF
jgi:hypothetical protein